MTFVSSPSLNLREWPTSTKRPSLIATEDTTRLSGSIVWMRPLTSRTSGSGCDGPLRRFFGSGFHIPSAEIVSSAPLAAAAAAAVFMNLRRENLLSLSSVVMACSLLSSAALGTDPGLGFVRLRPAVVARGEHLRHQEIVRVDQQPELRPVALREAHVLRRLSPVDLVVQRRAGLGD